jgi:hypothetical protein
MGLSLLSVLGFLIAGYHPGAEDDGVYLAAIQQRLNPNLFRVDADFFAVKLKATMYIRLMAFVLQSLHVPLPLMMLAGHLLTIFAILAACYRIASHCCQHEYARWCGVGLVTVFFTLPITGTGLYIVDQYLVPRAIATALALFAVDAVLGRRYWLGCALAAAAFVFHPVIAAFGLSLCCFLALPWPLPAFRQPVMASALLPLAWLFNTGPLPSALHRAISMHDYCMLARWEWYEWLGVVAPVLLLRWFAQLARAKGQGGASMAHVSRRTAAFGVFQFAVALLIMLPPALERMRPLEPMRYLHLIYVLMILLGGCLLGEHLLGRNRWKWALLFVPAMLGMFLAQRALYPGSPHLELPGLRPSNPWLQSFNWIRENTPQDAYFVLGPDYMHRPGEDTHGFRALALRSALADNAKDSAMVVTSPQLAARWQQEVDAQSAIPDWQHVTEADLRGLKAKFGVNWVILERPLSVTLQCPYRNERVEVCQID